MARKSKDQANGTETKDPADAASPDHEHNLQARKTIINECASGMREIKRERQDLNERAAEIRQRLKDAGISVEAFMYAQRIAEKDADDREAYMDNVHEQFMARGLGYQADFFKSAAEDADAAEGEDGKDVRPPFLKEKSEQKEAEAPA